MTRLDKDSIGSLIVFAFSIWAWTFLDEMPAGAALFPRMILILAAVLSVIWGVSAQVKRVSRARRGVVEAPRKLIANPANIAIFFACAVAYAALIDLIGYFSASGLFVIATSLLLGYRRPLVVIATAAGFVLFIYLVFVVIFERPLPPEFFQIH
ncbi:tripartite tricarboxylate transporter TctB family protein [Acuticoccus kandeliae]|uniref:tripartite tricarboxylate transporter TctB family protein n=1 Tax=Acuticoccus kandeliae TaxID=2073160 RepID=UPI0013002DEF|nr:tripartite tricarboxylate transporter TctB family protein [Acuticoccus kandeliae]